MGSLISEAHLKKVISTAKLAKRGCQRDTGGQRMSEISLAKFFHEPSIFADCTPDMKLVREEIFGPVRLSRHFLMKQMQIILSNVVTIE
jgi:betaine-aldehyde dehydrogenase